MITFVFRSQAALPPAWRHGLGVSSFSFFSLAHVTTLALLHPEGLCGFCLDPVFFFSSTSLFLCRSFFFLTLLLGSEGYRPRPSTLEQTK